MVELLSRIRSDAQFAGRYLAWQSGAVSLFARFVTQLYHYLHDLPDFCHCCDIFLPQTVTALHLPTPNERLVSSWSQVVALVHTLYSFAIHTDLSNFVRIHYDFYATFS